MKTKEIKDHIAFYMDQAVTAKTERTRRSAQGMLRSYAGDTNVFLKTQGKFVMPIIQVFGQISLKGETKNDRIDAVYNLNQLMYNNDFDTFCEDDCKNTLLEALADVIKSAPTSEERLHGISKLDEQLIREQNSKSMGTILAILGEHAQTAEMPQERMKALKICAKAGSVDRKIATLLLHTIEFGATQEERIQAMDDLETILLECVDHEDTSTSLNLYHKVFRNDELAYDEKKMAQDTLNKLMEHDTVIKHASAKILMASNVLLFSKEKDVRTESERLFDVWVENHKSQPGAIKKIAKSVAYKADAMEENARNTAGIFAKNGKMRDTLQKELAMTDYFKNLQQKLKVS